MWEPGLRVEDSDANVCVWNTPSGPVVRVEVLARDLTVPQVVDEVIAHIERELSPAREADLTDTEDELNPGAAATNVVLHLHRGRDGEYGRGNGPLNAPADYPRTNLRALMESALSRLRTA